MAHKNWALIVKVKVLPDQDLWVVHEFGTKTKLQLLYATHPYLASNYEGQIVRKNAAKAILKLLNG